MNLNELTIQEARDGLDKKEFTSVELTQACLDRIHDRNEEINAFITVTDELALEEARKADEMIARGEQKMLTGIPYSVKDAICTLDVRSTASAKILDNYIPPFDATVIRKIREQGAVLVGKTNCDAFGHGASNEQSMYGPVKNPHDTSKVAGGSSGGAAASVADHQCLFAIAEDTGGSIRQPAALCGVYGIRPSYGRNSRYGIMPMASSFDTVGPMAKTASDIAIVMEVMAGVDAKDATTVPEDVPVYSEELQNADFNMQNIRIGVPKEYFEIEGLDPEVKEAIEEKITSLENAGATIVPVSLPHTKYAIPVYYIAVPSEDSSNLGRIDGIRYGVQADMENLYNTYAHSRAHGFPEEVKRRIMVGTYALSAGYYDAYYRKAQQVRTLIMQDFDTVFQDVDVLITPTSPFPAFGIGEKKDDVIAMYLADVFVSPGAVAGIPGISVPAGNTKAGLPIGLQIMGPRMGESKILQVANVL
ncbi:MAG: Asp-tRNA(Asn)/Glu-tRNA(Gln) amidotransferase GatCAB subunit A [Candidatus Magasanikbacteria bacterium CG_4_9_14_0_2_um_filter_42_11]|uniref:Glutamyl-tRNA(Gln) amidotransferase subunit A n=1 Tax=Candidatus Magasanikbacteria bacterium CG_4_9_14_0_2_um_filter_42_11 TaxID=1974643 RepID=A0A2M8F8Q5_9BACT|nr:MAG: Asp-tRNA(Asn)/Glu-tRNA(Gln) amidotransferase GatCAB subunit A [Candidatus Magasanikbacteria bacterium CG10_big_fil_rev_8_21_14_0_10_43_9]PIY92472.1 MAG: Asp-tRNA(Asn)/Glu-tRNA(Gln) amidotransferase GatCAB subunit A [Candidatus Magasanikbacteria bacterium CG_4_10_14_0_8_um_filter_42_12]PJC52102.1 MAG: Asp-tRNA(Asn)/Glu-tRNA(Gln) amidotransferase GatCAB subunit A [Candidatus Magasanikbacteria bacterium CG_4_9_14_0_2_um_filter_42_11]